MARRGLRGRGPPHRPRDEPARWFWVAALFAGTPVLCLFVFSVLITPAINARYLLVALPGYWLFVSLACFMGRRPGRALLAIVTVWVAASAAVAVALNVRTSTARRAAELLDRELRPTDQVVVQQHMSIGWELHWEWTRRIGRTEQFTILTVPWSPGWLRNIVPGVDPAELDLGGANRVWYVTWNDRRAEEFAARAARDGFTPALAGTGLAAVLLFERSSLDSVVSR